MQNCHPYDFPIFQGIVLHVLHLCPKLQNLDLYQVCLLNLTIVFDFCFLSFLNIQVCIVLFLLYY